MKRLLIWDIDGTLLTCHGTGKAALSLTLEHIYGIKNGFEPIDLAGKLDRVSIKEAMDFHGIKAFNYEEFYYRYSENIFKSFEQGAYTTVLPHVEGVLSHYAKEADTYFSLATGNAKEGALVKLEHAGLDHFFQVGAFGDAYDHRNDLTLDAYHLARSYFGQDFQEVYVIGDTIHDILSAKANGFISVAVATGSTPKDELESQMPDYIIESMDELLHVIK